MEYNLADLFESIVDVVPDREALVYVDPPGPGAERRLTRRVGIVTENYFFSGVSDNPLVSLAARFMGEQLAVDFGLVTVLGSDVSFGAAPFVGFVFNF